AAQYSRWPFAPKKPREERLVAPRVVRVAPPGLIFEIRCSILNSVDLRTILLRASLGLVLINDATETLSQWQRKWASKWRKQPFVILGLELLLQLLDGCDAPDEDQGLLARVEGLSHGSNQCVHLGVGQLALKALPITLCQAVHGMYVEALFVVTFRLIAVE